MLVFLTLNSKYEVDTENRRIRRVEGQYDTTHNQGADGEWKEYDSISPIEVGSAVVIHWGEERVGEEFISRNTVTSTVAVVLNQN